MKLLCLMPEKNTNIRRKMQNPIVSGQVFIHDVNKMFYLIIEFFSIINMYGETSLFRGEVCCGRGLLWKMI